MNLVTSIEASVFPVRSGKLWATILMNTPRFLHKSGIIFVRSVVCIRLSNGITDQNVPAPKSSLFFEKLPMSDIDDLLKRLDADGAISDTVKEAFIRAAADGKLNEFVEKAKATANSSETIAAAILALLENYSIPVVGGALSMIVSTFLANVEVETKKGAESKQLLYDGVDRLYKHMIEVYKAKKEHDNPFIKPKPH